MMDESLLKSNFIGRDGFRWWIGQIPPNTVMDKQINGGGWGIRYKVRIMGYHPANEQELSNDDLPYAQVLIPPTAGTGGGNRHSSVLLTPGDIVFGFFLDGDNAQIPVIMGAFARTAGVPEPEYSQPFVPFTGHTNRVKKPPKSTLPQGQAGDQNAEAQKSPIHVSPSQAVGIGTNEVSYSSVIGDALYPANSSPASTINKINTEVNNLINFAQNISAIASDSGSYANKVINFEISRVTTKVQDITTGLVNGAINGLYKDLAPLINQGLKLLYEQVYNLVLAATQNPILAHQAGVAAQQAMVGPVIDLQQQIPSLANTIIGSLGGLINSILTSTVGNMNNFTTCAGDQFTGVLTNSIIGQVSRGLSSQIGAIGQITQFFGGFSIDNQMRNNSQILGGFGQIVNKGQSPTNFNSSVNEWVIGRGPKSSKLPNFSDILKTANNAYALANTIKTPQVSETQALTQTFTNFAKSSASPKNTECYTGKPVACNAPVINLFGSDGSGAAAIPILGNIVGTGRNRTGSIIGVKVANRGSGYDFPPFVEIVDNCNQGYGAVARAVLDDNGQLDYIYIVSEGENYPVGELEPYYITGVNIVNPGQDYVNGDIVIDNFGNTYSAQVLNGEIVKVDPLNIVSVTDLPILTIVSDEGSGAILSPIFENLTNEEVLQKQLEKPIDRKVQVADEEKVPGRKVIQTQGEIKQVIDCIET